MMTLTMFAVFLAHVLLGLPLFIALLTTAAVGFLFVDPAMIPRMMPQQFFGGINAFSLMAIPLFILAGNLMNTSRLTDRLMTLARLLVGHLRGGMGHVNVVSSVFFAGVNGSAVADTSALGSLLVPPMRKEGYSTAFAAGLTAGSSLIGPIIPPSIFMILYASLTNTSVGDLFLAGVIPGLLLGAAFMAMNAWYARRRGLEKRGSWPGGAELGRATLGALPALIAPFIIVAGIVMGLVTPTESGALTALYVALYGLAMGNLGPRDFWRAIVETTRLTGAIFIIMAASATVSWLLSYAQVPSQFVELLTPYIEQPVLILLLLSAITFVTGMFMEEVSALMLLTPIFAPVAMMAGIDPVHLGIIITLNITIALITPPMGACVFVAAAVSRLEITALFRTIWPFVVTALLVLAALILFPPLTLWLPTILG
ncbi:TRAP transporter large permease [Halomonas elongata]|uniref:TRAP transporter large permease protein n=2 Tax=Halomonas elongata TaxID=2746 RepID=E1VBF2_HALED|nr:TRAP transporter large permease [Halomonas elongata]WPU46721.1 TRAP transporter large permease [Halomonas elongata DSM 2581]WVI71440.1 TRAP transporter large permease [Halomonas elongata]CBV44109.1 TRAP transporter large transmembrane protein (probable substrate D-Ala-D-Ala) [Halomonas elongata DSM 2581]